MPVRQRTLNQREQEREETLASAFEDLFDAITALTVSTGGSATDTLAAATNLSALTVSSGDATPDTTVADVSTAVGQAENAGSADKADVDARLVAIDSNFADVGAQLVAQRTLNTVIINALTSIGTKINAVLAANPLFSGITALTVSTGGSATDTLAAATNLGSLTISSGDGTPDTTIADVSTAVGEAQNAGSADKADVDTRLVAIDSNFADVAAQLAAQRTLNTVIINSLTSIGTKLNEILTEGQA